MEKFITSRLGKTRTARDLISLHRITDQFEAYWYCKRDPDENQALREFGQIILSMIELCTSDDMEVQYYHLKKLEEYQGSPRDALEIPEIEDSNSFIKDRDQAVRIFQAFKKTYVFSSD